MPSDAVSNCAESVVEDNPDLSKSQAFAICQAMENEGELAAGDILAAIRDLGIEDDIPDTTLDDLEASTREQASPTGRRVHRGLGLGEGVRRTENDDGSVTYHNLAILAPGEWTDAASEETLFYSPEAIERIADQPDEHVVDTSVNVNHDHQNQLAQVGSFDPASLTTDDEGVLYADVTLHGRTQASDDAIGLVDLALETEGERGAGGPSVEIPREGEVTEWDSDRGLERMVEFNLSGLALVTNSASEDVAFDEQLADRPVAMAQDAASEIHLMRPADPSDITDARPALDMNADDFRSMLQEETMDEEAIRDIVRDELASDDGGNSGEESTDEQLQDGEEGEEEFDTQVEELRQVLEQAISERAGDDMPEDEARAEIVSEIAEAAGRDEDTVNAIIDGEIDEVPDGVAAAIAEVLNVDLEEIGEDTPESEEEGGDDEREEQAPSEEIETLEAQNEQLQATVDDLEQRLEAIEDEPQPRSLRETAQADADDNESEPQEVKSGFSRDGAYFTR